MDQGSYWLAQLKAVVAAHGAQRDTGCGLDGVLVGRQQCDGAGTRLLEVVFPADEQVVAGELCFGEGARHPPVCASVYMP